MNKSNNNIKKIEEDLNNLIKKINSNKKNLTLRNKNRNNQYRQIGYPTYNSVKNNIHKTLRNKTINQQLNYLKNYTWEKPTLFTTKQGRLNKAIHRMSLNKTIANQTHWLESTINMNMNLRKQRMNQIHAIQQNKHKNHYPVAEKQARIVRDILLRIYTLLKSSNDGDIYDVKYIYKKVRKLLLDLEENMYFKYYRKYYDGVLYDIENFLYGK